MNRGKLWAEVVEDYCTGRSETILQEGEDLDLRGSKVDKNAALVTPTMLRKYPSYKRPLSECGDFTSTWAHHFRGPIILLKSILKSVIKRTLGWD